MVVFPHCKINLGLQVLSKRPDGYHTIETCFYPVPWTDILEIIPSETFSFSVSGDSIPGKESDNLCVRAYDLLKTDFSLPPVQMHLHKIVPTGAGLGGGSSNAAFTLRLLNEKFQLNISHRALIRYASKLGSDCAFFVQDKAMLGEGRGEVLHESQLNLKNYYILIIKPDLHIATAGAYAGIVPVPGRKPVREIIQLPVSDWKNNLVNDFEESVFKKYPHIAMIKSELYRQGAVYASMSGSGAAVFGLFSEEKILTENFSGCRYWSGWLN
jgi:4-diphosphocytidyl-2-C-methyl-D-erythritol kinase